jgi:uncharacterized membrane protein
MTFATTVGLTSTTYSAEVNGIMTERELDFAVQQIDSYVQVINNRYLRGDITKEQYTKHLMKLDQWFRTLDYLWDRVHEC